MSPHILIDQALESLEPPESPPGSSKVVLHMITKMMEGGAISVEEFNHYCKRLLKITRQRT
ncbi:hypothetical protein EPZ47_18775 [Pseudomonas viciae]|uniref:Uncharacterized protein n=1 Tax=Pseudomonas viciae TaxID=2505979 RepID=A0A4P7PJT9_9PSED|nr:hypothetical protein [Pseudomonas viciae]QBZ90672.1 hypothetical protein EPZ47_18775 [Pseudomonas viciae]